MGCNGTGSPLVPRLSLILLHGYAETSRMLRPIIPLLAKKFAITAPDLADIGDSAIPESGIDRLTSAKRVHAPARSLGGDKRESSGTTSDLWWPVLTPPNSLRKPETGADGRFLPGVPGWEPI